MYTKNQTASFFISFTRPKHLTIMRSVNIFIFTQILINLTNLRCLKFDPYPNHYGELSFDVSSPTIISSTLLELHVRVEKSYRLSLFT